MGEDARSVPSKELGEKGECLFQSPERSQPRGWEGAGRRRGRRRGRPRQKPPGAAAFFSVGAERPGRPSCGRVT